MEFAKKNRDAIVHLYVEQGKSSYEVADALNTYSTKILRALDYLGIPKRNYSDAQTKALEQGRSVHPTKGKKLKESHKQKIGKQRSKAWSNLTAEERAKISEMSKKQWQEKSDSEKRELQRLAHEAVREASKNGSKTERFLKNNLESKGYNVIFHKTNLVPHSSLEVDLFIPEMKTAIEIDGPSHFLPIWGQKKLTKQQSDDIIKQGILIDAGYVVIRVKQPQKSVSVTKMLDLLSTIENELEKIKTKFPSPKNRLIEIEV